MSHRAQLIALFAAMAACLLLLLWVGASRPSPLRPAAVEPQHNAQSTNKDGQQKTSQDPFSAFWRWITHDATTFSTVGIFVFTIVLAFSTIGLWVATARSVALGRDEFLATHRPQIVVHKFEFINPERRVGTRFTYVNAGSTPARVLRIGHNIFWQDAAVNMKHQAIDRTLAAGEGDVHLIQSEIDDTRVYFETVVAQRKGSTERRIKCVGYVRYVDARGAVRETGFCRIYDASTHTWIRMDDADYEYSY